MADVAYLAGGKLHLRVGDGEARVVESPFVEQVRTRATRVAERNAWKTQGRGARFMMGLGGMPDAEEELNAGAPPLPARLTGLSRGPGEGRLLYSLSTGAVNGLFTAGLRDGEEQRLFHSAGLAVSDPCAHPAESLIACTLRGKGGLTRIAVMRADGTDLTEVTEGDSVDAAPSWVPGAAHHVVYHSAGVGRDAAGQIVDLAPFSVQRLDLDKGEVTCVATEPGADLVSPRVAPDGALYCIRRPHTTRRGGSFLRLVGDVVLFPFRLLWAVLQWFNFFTVRYTGKPLITAGGQKGRRADMRRLLIAGNLLDAARSAGREDDEARADPSWHLVRRRGGEDAPWEVVARGVACYDLGGDGAIVWSDGGALHHLAPDGSAKKLAAAKGVERVVLLGD